MSFLFKNNKSKQFDYKSFYHDPQDEDDGKQIKKIKFAQEMYMRWERIPFSVLEKQGKRSVMRLSILIVAFIFVAIYIYELYQEKLTGL
tara:strand:- start:669 stop:935 length:267 start_codon:yes stop_codon:yes gene_type:complete